MLMIQPRPKRVTEHGEKLLVALQAADGQWIGRTEIAASIEKKRLTPYDVALLDLLVERKLIEVRQLPGRSRDGYVWQYRAVTGKK